MWEVLPASEEALPVWFERCQTPRNAEAPGSGHDHSFEPQFVHNGITLVHGGISRNSTSVLPLRISRPSRHLLPEA